MPQMPVAACSQPLCSEPAWNRGRCQTHQYANDKQIKADTKYRQVYSTKRWRSLRMQVFKEQRGRCAVPDCINMATDLDHITPLREGGSPYARSNVQGLCKKHHSMKTLSEVIHKKG